MKKAIENKFSEPAIVDGVMRPEIREAWLAKANESWQHSHMYHKLGECRCAMGLLVELLEPERFKQGGYIGDVYAHHGLFGICTDVVKFNNSLVRTNADERGKELRVWVERHIPVAA